MGCAHPFRQKIMFEEGGCGLNKVGELPDLSLSAPDSEPKAEAQHGPPAVCSPNLAPLLPSQHLLLYGATPGFSSLL